MKLSALFPKFESCCLFAILVTPLGLTGCPQANPPTVDSEVVIGEAETDDDVTAAEAAANPIDADTAATPPENPDPTPATVPELDSPSMNERGATGSEQGASGARVDSSESAAMPTKVDREQRVQVELESMRVQVTEEDGHIVGISTETAPGFGDGEIELLLGLPKLETVNLHNSDVSDEGLKKLTQNKSIKRLNLRRTAKITADGLASLVDLPNLQVLELLYNSQSVDNAALDHVAKLTGLRLLDLRGCFQVGDEGLLKLKTLTRMEDLKLRCTELTDEGLAVIGSMPNLKYLTVEDANGMRCETLTAAKDNDNFKSLTLFRLDLDDEDLAPFEGCANVVKLNFRDTAVFGEGLDYFAQSADKVQSINLAESLFDDDYASHLTQFTNLRELDLWQTDITDAGLEELAKLKNLKTLILLQDRDITNEGIKTLSSMKSLEVLDLSETSIDDDAIEYLKELPNLKTLKVAQTRMTREAAEALLETHPDLDIQF